MTGGMGNLPPAERQIHRALMVGVLATGTVPDHAELAATTGVPVADLPRCLAKLAAADYLALDEVGRVICLYPLSPSPTKHVVSIGNRRRYAMCAIDALGVAAMLNQVVDLDAVCADCGSAIRMAVAPGRIVRAEPEEAVVLSQRSGEEPAWKTCCPQNLFACNPVHGEAAAANVSEISVLSLTDGLRHAEAIFGGLLATSLPENRPRPRTAES